MLDKLRRPAQPSENQSPAVRSLAKTTSSTCARSARSRFPADAAVLPTRPFAVLSSFGPPLSVAYFRSPFLPLSGPLFFVCFAGLCGASFHGPFLPSSGLFSLFALLWIYCSVLTSYFGVVCLALYFSFVLTCAVTPFVHLCCVFQCTFILKNVVVVGSRSRWSPATSRILAIATVLYCSAE